jgi:hypothetical protein
MPYSVHIFGNFFIHGIPYYPDGVKVSSTYSGGCIRLEDNEAKAVFDFVEKDTPIIITNESTPLEDSTILLSKKEMLNFMAAAVSLEFLTQDNDIWFEGATTTRRTLLPRLLQGDYTVSALYAKSIGTEQLLKDMNAKAQSIGLTQTLFTDLTTEPITSSADLILFSNYIQTYKSYLFAAQQGNY